MPPFEAPISRVIGKQRVLSPRPCQQNLRLSLWLHCIYTKTAITAAGHLPFLCHVYSWTASNLKRLWDLLFLASGRADLVPFADFIFFFDLSFTIFKPLFTFFFLTKVAQARVSKCLQNEWNRFCPNSLDQIYRRFNVSKTQKQHSPFNCCPTPPPPPPPPLLCW